MRQKNNILADAENFLRIKIDLTDFKNENRYLKKLLKAAGYLDTKDKIK